MVWAWYGRSFVGFSPLCLYVKANHKLLVLGSGDSWMYPYQRTPMGNPYISPMPISTMGTLLGVHPIVH